MSGETDKLIEGHEYDGIQEFDNPLPNWWLGILFGTMLFAVVYFYYYTVGGGPTPLQEMQAQVEELQAQKKTGPSYTEETLLAAFTDSAKAKGSQAFAAKCAPCHAPTGGGLIGPNLTDKHWLNGTGTAMDIYKIIAEGVPAKGMPPWAEQVTPEELVGLTAFVFAMKGTNVSGGKPAQGNEFP